MPYLSPPGLIPTCQVGETQGGDDRGMETLAPAPALLQPMSDHAPLPRSSRRR